MLRLYFQVRKYSAAMDVTLEVSVVNTNGTLAATYTHRVKPLGNPYVDLNIPLTQCLPGTYRLQVKARSGTESDFREVGFVIR